MATASTQRPVAVEHGVPVDARHVGDPEVVAHEPAGLVEHLAPLGGRVDRDDDPAQVDGVLVGARVDRLVGGRVAGRSVRSTRSVAPSRTTSRVPSPLTA